MQPPKSPFASITASCEQAAWAAAVAILLSVCGTTPVSAQTLPVPDPASVLYACDFSTSFTSCGFSEQSLVPGRATIVNVGRDGTTGIRLHTEPGDVNVAGSGANERDDLELSDAASACSEGQEAWWAHSILFPDDYVAVPESTGSAWNFGVVADFHQSSGTGLVTFEVDAMPDTAISPDRPTGLQMHGAGGDPNNPTQYSAAVGPIVRNVWYDFVYHVRWSSSADGFFYAWVNGVQKLAYTGPTLYAGQTCYFKLANYHTAFGEATSVVHDRVIRGATPNAVAFQVLQGVAMPVTSGPTPPAADTTSPTTPAGLTATAASPSQINLSWGASTDDVGVTGYRVYRGGALLVTLGAVTSYQDAGLQPSTAYSYAVQAIDAAGNASGQSPAASAVTPAAPDSTAPSTPAALTASPVSSSQINLSWTASTDNVAVAGYRLYRGGALLVTLGAVTTYQDTGLRPSTAYSYTVQAIDAAGNPSGQSIAASATTPAVADTLAPSVPTGLKATPVSGTQIALSWKASTDNVKVAGYTVYVNDTALATTAGRSFQHTGLTPGTTYAYRVSAFDAAGNNSAWTATPLSVTTPKRRIASGDFDGDGKSDILWRNASTGANSIWLMSTAAIVSSTVFSTVADFTWGIAGVGDFDGDGKADILLHNSVSGGSQIWLMNGATILNDAAVASQLDPAWTVAGVGDFDGDGKADVLWRNGATGAVTVWLMNGATVAGTATGFATLDPNWRVAALGDFDGDGKTDVLWRNGATGEDLIWLMNGTAIASAASIPALPDLTWSIAGAGDFDGDGKADILWRNTATGQDAIWFMNGATLSSGPFIATVADLNWSIAGTGDFNGDGKADILWRNAATGQDAIWFMNAATLSSGPYIATVTDANSSIAFP
jgi:chitodextrinase